MVALVSRRGRTMQRYNSGCRLVAGKTDKPSLGDIDQAIEGKLGKWPSKEQDKIHHMFAMRVTEVLPQWPEMNARERKWVGVARKHANRMHASCSFTEGWIPDVFFCVDSVGEPPGERGGSKRSMQACMDE
ncbi:hypothetical protein GW17_00045714 [Ensete ventricosum]|nr:hypothetical protein GW17_00045714 [Ensete ventricosum]